LLAEQLVSPIRIGTSISGATVLIEFFRLLNRPCRDMTALISQSQDRRLSRSERWALRLHVLYCRACRRFGRQIRLLRDTLQRLAEADNSLETGTAGLSPEARNRIRDHLSRE
jgi:hypothetical protein